MARDRAEARADPIPVVLVHGFLSTRDMVAPLARRLGARGFDVHQPKLSPFCIQDVRKLARELSDGVGRTLEHSGSPRCDLVGVSQGGIIALYYLKLLSGGPRVRRLVTVASPFDGTWAPLAGLLGAPVLGWVSRGVWQLIPGSGLLGEIRKAPAVAGVEVTTIAIEGDLIAPPSRCHLQGARNVTVPGVPLVAHQWLILSLPVVDAVAEALRAGGAP
jgi:triacylglycerol lipase